MYNILSYFKHVETPPESITIAVAESVTAGAVSNLLCREPGASKFFKGSVVAYSIQSKKDILGIDMQYAEKNNYANPFTTSEMARSITKMFKSRLGLSTTGYSLPLYRQATDNECELDIKNPYAYICLYDNNTNYENILRIDSEYDPTQSDEKQRALFQVQVAVASKTMYYDYLDKIK